MRRARVVHVTSLPETVRHLLAAQLRALDAAGWDVHVVTSPERNRPGSSIPGITWHQIPLPRQISPLQDARALDRLTRLFHRLAPEVVHTHSMKAAGFGLDAARLARVPVRAHTVHNYHHLRARGRLERALSRAWERRVLARCHQALFVSRADLAYADELLGPGGPIRSWLGNGVDLDRHRPPSAAARARARERLGLSPDDRVLITVGRFTEEKGLDRVLATFSHLVRFDPRARLLAVGASLPGDRAVPISLATDLGIPDRHIHAPGWLEDVRPALHAADVYVILSRGEGRSTAAMEAAAAGLPIVAAWIPGIEEVVHDGHNGLLVDGEAPVQVAEAIGDLWTDAVRCGAYARASRALAEHAFDQADVDRRLLTAYAAWGEVRRDAAVRPRAGT